MGLRPLPSMGGGSSRAKGLRSQHQEEQEGEADRSLHGKDARLEFQRQVVAEDRHGGAEDGEDEHPQQHRAFVVSPHAGNLVDQRLGRMGILGHVEHREIRDDIGVGQRDEGDADQQDLQQCRRRCAAHQHAVAALGAIERHQELEDRDGEGQNQREMANFDDHCSAPLPSTPFSFSLSATSFGM